MILSQTAARAAVDGLPAVTRSLEILKAAMETLKPATDPTDFVKKFEASMDSLGPLMSDDTMALLSDCFNKFDENNTQRRPATSATERLVLRAVVAFGNRFLRTYSTQLTSMSVTADCLMAVWVIMRLLQ